MASVPLHYLDLRAFCYATEDDQRVESALRTLLPEDVPVARSTSSGHHGDRIVLLSCRVETADELRAILGRVRAAPEFERITETISDRVDEDCAFFVRLDKQAAYQGEIRLGPGIQLRGKIESYPASRETAIDNLQHYFDTTAD